MSRKTIFTLTLAAGAAGGFAAAVCMGAAFFFFNQTAQTVEAVPMSPKPLEKPAAPAETPTAAPAPREIRASDVASVSISPSFTDFFAPGTPCSRSYNEVYGTADGVYSVSPPCYVSITFDRDGTARKSVEIYRYGRAAKERRVLETRRSTGTITAEQFNALTAAIVDNVVFKNWTDGVGVTVSNCKIDVASASGARRGMMANVDKSATEFLKMTDAFKKLDREIQWKDN